MNVFPLFCIGLVAAITQATPQKAWPLHDLQKAHCQSCSLHNSTAYVIFKKSVFEKKVNLINEEALGQCVTTDTAWLFMEKDIEHVLCGGRGKWRMCRDLNLNAPMHGLLKDHLCTNWIHQYNASKPFAWNEHEATNDINEQRNLTKRILDSQLIFSKDNVNFTLYEKALLNGFQNRCYDCVKANNILTVRATNDKIINITCLDGVDSRTSVKWTPTLSRIACSLADCNPSLLNQDYGDNMLLCAMEQGLVGYVRNYPKTSFMGIPLAALIQHTYSSRATRGFRTVKTGAELINRNLPEWDFEVDQLF